MKQEEFYDFIVRLIKGYIKFSIVIVCLAILFSIVLIFILSR